jgi:hypothetical protein
VQTGNLFQDEVPVGTLTVFHADLIDCEQTGWEALFDGYDSLKAITFSSSIEFLARLVPRFGDVEIVFGSQRVLSKEHVALAQASEAYTFGDVLADQKAFTEALAQFLSKHGEKLMARVLDGTLRFRLLRTGEIVINFGRDTNQAAQFARGVPDFVLKGRFADVVRLDLQAIEKEMRMSVDAGRSFWAKLLRRH